MKPVATGDLAEMVRKVLDKAKGTTQQSLSETVEYLQVGFLKDTDTILD